MKREVVCRVKRERRMRTMDCMVVGCSTRALIGIVSKDCWKLSALKTKVRMISSLYIVCCWITRLYP